MAPAPAAPAPAAPAPAVAPQTAPPPPARQEFVYRGEATSILGRSVHGPDGDTVGRIVDVLVDDLGQPRGAVIDVGGFMGLGSRRIAVAWRALRFVPAQGSGGRVELEMTLDQIKGTPDYRRPASSSDPPVTLAAPPPRPAAAPAAPAVPAAPVAPAGTPLPSTAGAPASRTPAPPSTPQGGAPPP